MQDAVIVDCVRTAVGKAPRGALRHTRPDDLAAYAIKAAARTSPDIPAGGRGGRDSRVCDARSRIGTEHGAYRGSARRIAGFGARNDHQPVLLFGLAGDCARRGTDTGRRRANHDCRGQRVDEFTAPRGACFFAQSYLVEHMPEVYMGMGQTAERLYGRYGISREDQDAFAFRSHQRALAAQAAGKFRR